MSLKGIYIIAGALLIFLGAFNRFIVGSLGVPNGLIAIGCGWFGGRLIGKAATLR